MSTEAGGLWAHWGPADEILQRALSLEPSARRPYVRSACADHPELLTLLEELLDAGERPDPRLEHARQAILAAVLDEDREAHDPIQIGDLVGRYRIVACIGRGGMATVYEAERADGAFSQRVAVKVLRRGLDTGEMVRRFEDEREILSELTHPNIATIIDGGSTGDGRPFLVMELVSGQRLTAWVRSHDPYVEARLELFLQAAEAVRFAHSRLVVHRDIKPSNVRVDDEGRVKLLDFGIAKILTSDDRALRTVDTVALTPAYASPEQARGQSVTTSSDVFQLGLLLSEILTDGEWDIDDRPSDVEAQSRGLPVRPSRIAERAGNRRLAARLRGDLDAIVETSTREDPSDRYVSVEAMMADVRRHLDARPIAARPPSLGYRLGKLHMRNRWLAPIAALIVALTSGYVATISLQANRLEAERNRARESAERAGALRRLLVGQFDAADPWGSDPERAREITMIEALEGAADRARDVLSGQPLLLAGILSDVADVHESLDLRVKAIDLLQEAMALRSAVGEGESSDQRDDMGLLSSLIASESLPDSARALAERRLELERASSPRDDRRVALALGSLARVENAAGRYEAADTLLSRGITLLRREAGSRDALARQLEDRAVTLQALEDLETAERSVREAIEIRRGLVDSDHPTLAVSEEHLAQVLYSAGRLEESVDLHRTALRKLEASLGPEHSTTMATLNNLALVLGAMRDFEGATEVHRTLLERELTNGAGSESARVAASMQNLAAMLLRSGRLAEADSLAARAGTMFARLHGPDHYTVGFSLLTRAEIALLRGDGVGASALASSAGVLLRASLPEGHYSVAVAECRDAGGRLLQDEPGEASRAARDALRILRASRTAPDRVIAECERIAAQASQYANSPGR